MPPTLQFLLLNEKLAGEGSILDRPGFDQVPVRTINK